MVWKTPPINIDYLSPTLSMTHIAKKLIGTKVKVVMNVKVLTTSFPYRNDFSNTFSIG